MNDVLAERFQRDGYVVVEDFFHPRLVQDLVDDVKRVFFMRDRREDVAHIDDAALDQRLKMLFAEDFATYHGAAKLCNHLLSLYRIAVDDKLDNLMQRIGVQHPTLAARPLMWFHAPQLAKTPRYAKLPAHQEWSNMQGSLDGVVAWTPLVNIDAEMGRLQVVPGSHTAGLLPFGADDAADYPLALDDQDHDFVEVEVPPCGLLLFSAFLIHRSGENHSDRARLTVNFRYNNATEPTFIERRYVDPFHYAVATELVTPDFWPGATGASDERRSA